MDARQPAHAAAGAADRERARALAVAATRASRRPRSTSASPTSSRRASGLAWDATGDRKTKVYGSWGVFHDITKLQITAGLRRTQWSNSFWFTLDSADFRPIVDNPACPPACPGSLILGGLTDRPAQRPGRSTHRPGAGQMRLQEFVIGVERELAPRSRRARGTSTSRSIGRSKTSGRSCREKRSRRVSASPTPASAPRREFFPGGGSTPLALPKAVRDYDAVEVTLDRRLSGRWAARAVVHVEPAVGQLLRSRPVR